MKLHLKNLSDRLIAIVVLICITILASGSAIAINTLIDYNFYNDNGKHAWSFYLYEKAQKEFEEIEQVYYGYLIENYEIGKPLPRIGNGYDAEGNPLLDRSTLLQYSRENCNYFFNVKDENGDIVWYNYLLNASGATVTTGDETQQIHGTVPVQYNPVKGCSVYIFSGEKVSFTIELYVPESSEWIAHDGIYNAYRWIELADDLKYALFFFIALAFAVMVILLIMLTLSSGKTNEKGELTEGFLDRIPLDIVVVVAVMFCLSSLSLPYLANLSNIDMVTNNIIIILAAVVVVLVILMFLNTLTSRIKMGKAFRNTLIYRIYLILARKTPKKVRSIYRKKSTFKQLLAAVLATVAFSLAIVLYFAYRYFILDDINFELYLIYWVISRMITIPIIIMFLLNFSYIKDEGEKIARGDLTEVEIDPQLLFKPFSVHNRNLELIKKDMSRALEHEMKSERFRNELISNISHDIKTPLTSILQYVRHLQKPNLTPEQYSEYAEIIGRQSERLNVLFMNLLEISKASAGVEVARLEEIDIGVLAEQFAGEYAELFEKHGLTIEFSKEDREYSVMADSNMLGRVFENLMNNALKYALENTRVFMKVEEENGKIKVSLRNISRDVIDRDPREFFERSARGDSSRNTEGHGLGLSIAKSLVELQHASIDIELDGDIFKIIIEFDSPDSKIKKTDTDE
ncbi:MAG: HAMP domain-containing histidine kinase [Clostridia bacterium]|nr:HAMP domain-containing histidine kinase [Clostridia bacterium]